MTDASKYHISLFSTTHLTTHPFSLFLAHLTPVQEQEQEQEQQQQEQQQSLRGFDLIFTCTGTLRRRNLL
jgi:hypothetical protein